MSCTIEAGEVLYLPSFWYVQKKQNVGSGYFSFTRAKISSRDNLNFKMSGNTKKCVSRASRPIFGLKIVSSYFFAFTHHKGLYLIVFVGGMKCEVLLMLTEGI